ncbi:hypothetical protein GBA52_010965 [Prunus armeniaca]|nr:hypothetical protein GBA52_010965 [Prunus armeniaca]
MRTDRGVNTHWREWPFGFPDFQKGHRRTPRHDATRAVFWTLPGLWTGRRPSRLGWWVRLVKQKTLSRGPADVSGLPNVAGQPPRPGSGILNPIPFRSSRETRYQTGFPRLLGSTNPCASAVHMEPFPSSAFKVLI